MHSYTIIQQKVYCHSLRCRKDCSYNINFCYYLLSIEDKCRGLRVSKEIILYSSDQQGIQKSDTDYVDVEY